MYIREKNGRYREAHKTELVAAALEVVSRDMQGKLLTSTDETRDWLKLELADLEAERFSIIFLDNRHRVLALEPLFNGTLDGAAVYPREVVKAVLRHNAAAVILAHNHPSGVAEPSQSDKQLTERLKAALALIDVRVLDHIVIGGGESVSFAERGLL